MITLDFSNFPELNTSRLLLRRLRNTDASDIFEFRSDPQVMQFIPRPLARTEEDVLEVMTMMEDFLVKNEKINWAMEWKETGKVLGTIGYVNIHPEHSRAEVGYSLNRAWHRQGIMREALEAVAEYGFKVLELHTIEAIIDAENLPSGKLLENFGFRQEAYFREDFYHNGVYRNSIHFGLLASEYDARNTKLSTSAALDAAMPH